MGTEIYIAFFTYNGASYAVSARGLPDGDFRGVIASVRKPGEVIEVPKPKKVKVVRRKKEKAPEEDITAQLLNGVSETSTAAVAGSTESVNGSTSAAEAAPASTRTAVGAAGEAANNFLNDLEKKQDNAGLPPYLPRAPLPFMLWAVIIGAWVAGSFVARGIAASYKNPKLPPPPAEVPPDYFFPFVASSVKTLRDVTYNVLTRQRQLLLAGYPYEHEMYLAGAVYGCFFFHVMWSLLAFTGRPDAVTNMLLRLPFGRAFASLPEVFFIIPFIAGLAVYFTKKPLLQIFDAQSTLVIEVKPEIVYGLIKDGAGKEVARLVRKGGMMNRYWEFVDTDNLVVLTIRDDFPKGYVLRKLFGNLGGALRAHYGIFAGERRAGFVFLDPSSSSRFQVHMDYAFARLAHPAQILAAVLYIISKEKDPIYPSPF